MSPVRAVVDARRLRQFVARSAAYVVRDETSPTLALLLRALEPLRHLDYHTLESWVTALGGQTQGLQPAKRLNLSSRINWRAFVVSSEVIEVNLFRVKTSQDSLTSKND